MRRPSTPSRTAGRACGRRTRCGRSTGPRSGTPRRRSIPPTDPTTLSVGGGISGLYAALLLKAAGAPVHVFEEDPERLAPRRGYAYSALVHVRPVGDPRSPAEDPNQLRSATHDC